MAEEHPTPESIIEELRLTCLRLGYVLLKLDDIAVCNYQEDTPLSLLERLGPRADEHREACVVSAMRDLAVNGTSLVDISRTNVFEPGRGDLERTNIRVAVINYDAFRSSAT